MAREHMVFSFQAAATAGNYDERPMLPDDVDLQVHLSRNDRPQPFWLICEHDTVIATLSGEGRIAFKASSVNYHTYQTGDFIYVPAGTPTRIFPDSRSILYRYKGAEAGLEGVAWYCEKCDYQIFREVWDTADELPQAAYQRITEGFNANAMGRKCRSCGKVYPKVDIKNLRWANIAKELSENLVA